MAIRIAEHRRLLARRVIDRAQLGATVTTTSHGNEKRSSSSRSLWSSSSSARCSPSPMVCSSPAILGFVLEPPISAPCARVLSRSALPRHRANGDRFTLANWPFAKLKDQAERLMGRVVLVQHRDHRRHLADGVPRFEGVVLQRVHLAEGVERLGTILPMWEPREAPGWLARMMSVFPKAERRIVRGILEAHARGTRKTSRARRAAKTMIARLIGLEGTPSTEQDVQHRGDSPGNRRKIRHRGEITPARHLLKEGRPRRRSGRGVQSSWSSTSWSLRGCRWGAWRRRPAARTWRSGRTRPRGAVTRDRASPCAESPITAHSLHLRSP